MGGSLLNYDCYYYYYYYYYSRGYRPFRRPLFQISFGFWGNLGALSGGLGDLLGGSRGPSCLVLLLSLELLNYFYHYHHHHYHDLLPTTYYLPPTT